MFDPIDYLANLTKQVMRRLAGDDQPREIHVHVEHVTIEAPAKRFGRS